jgi:hypothetical protein
MTMTNDELQATPAPPDRTLRRRTPPQRPCAPSACSSGSRGTSTVFKLKSSSMAMRMVQNKAVLTSTRRERPPKSRGSCSSSAIHRLGDWISLAPGCHSPAMLNVRRLETRRLDDRQSVTAREYLTPGIQRGERGRNSATLFSKGVAHFEWAASHLTPAYESGRRQIAERRAEHFFRDARNLPAQLGESRCALLDPRENDCAPPPAESGNRHVDTARVRTVLQ